jgi:hypothetical protein
VKTQKQQSSSGYENLAVLLTAAMLFIIVLAAVNSELIVQGIKVAFRH